MDKFIDKPINKISADTQEAKEESFKHLENLMKEPKTEETKVIIKTEKGLIEETEFIPSAPDFVGDDHNIVAWVHKRSPSGEIITLNVKIGEIRVKLRKRFL